MADNNQPMIGGILNLDISNLDLNIKQAKSMLKSLNTETQAALSGFDNWQDSVDGLETKLKSLAQREAILRQEQARYNDIIQKAIAGGKTNAEVIQVYRDKLNGVVISLNNTEKEQKKYNERLEELQENGGRTNTFFDAFKQKLTQLNPTLGKLIDGVSGSKIALASFAVTAGVATVKAIKAGVEAFIEYEDAFAGIRKTINGTEVDFENINTEIQSLAREIPKSASEIAEMAKLGGQLGIASDDVVDFAEVVLRLADTTNVVAESAGEMIAQIGAITGLDSSDYERFGSTLVALGNSASATEKEILDMSNRIARFSQSAKLSNQEILALATALTSMGIETEAGGTSLQKMFAKLTLAVETNSEELKGFAATAGMSAEEFSKLYKQSSIKGLQALLKGMNNLNEQSQSYTKTLADLDITEVRLSSVLQALASNQDGLTDALELSQKAWVENTELARSSGEVYDTLSSDIQVAKNNFTELSRNIGAVFAPMLSAVITKAGSLAQGINNVVNPLGKSTLAMDTAKDAISNYGAAVESAKGNLEEFTEAQKTSLQIGLKTALVDTIDAWGDLGKKINNAEKEIERLNKGREGYNDTTVESLEKLYVQQARAQGAIVNTFDEAYNAYLNMIGDKSKYLGGMELTYAQIQDKMTEINNLELQSDAYAEQRQKHVTMWAEAVNDGYLSLSLIEGLNKDLAKSVEETAIKLKAEAEATEARAKAEARWGQEIANAEQDAKDKIELLKGETGLNDKLIASLETLITEQQEIQKQFGKNTLEYDKAATAINVYSNAITSLSAEETTISKIQAELNKLNTQLLTASDALAAHPGDEGLAALIDDLNGSINTKQLELWNAQLETLLITGGNAEAVKAVVDNISRLKALTSETDQNVETVSVNTYYDDLTSAINSYGSEAEKAALKINQLEEAKAGWQKKLNESTDEEAKKNLTEIVRLYDEAIKRAKEGEDTTFDLDSYISKYGTEAQKLQQTLKELQDSATKVFEQLELDPDNVDLRILFRELNDDIKETKKNIDDLNKTGLQKFFEELFDGEDWLSYLKDDFLSALGQIGDAWVDLLDAGFDAEIEAKKNEINALDEQLEATLTKIEEQSKETEDSIKEQYSAGLISEIEYYKKSKKAETDYAKAKAKTEKEAAARKEQLKKEQQAIEKQQFDANKKNSIAQILIDAAVATIKAWTQGPVIGAATTASMAILSGLQIDAINKQQYIPALAHGGITTGPTMALIGDNPSGKEAVIPLEPKTMRRLASELAKAMNGRGNVYNNNNNADDNRSYVINQTITTPKGISRREAYLQARRALKSVQ